ncbi:hypothetical protein NO559_03260 [Dasania sp. GY-MA-18]|uniref:Uncharacterized protein n=1 Tax=Dasania phycosphaerae TaxID=2950436 RepID=A0A9J6RIK4_9GAMM|nr:MULTISPECIES: hypothetical protein [Dasania]MCR8921774.1 hypothetical protein [Dasania sp. GY-MA-18]MCZ0864202.1 hypothetical protein [Dasania phycosphaerae]MCZ0867930.1 hypothetical protein [Dasania phycosphaerae]
MSRPPTSTTSPAASSADLQQFANITQKLGEAYAHLHPTFFTNPICLLAKIDIHTANGRSLLDNPSLYADVLQTEHFVPVTLPSYKKEQSGCRLQYIFNDPSLQYACKDFELSASFGTSYISLQLQSAADLSKMALAIDYALQVIDKLYERINRVTTANAIKKLHSITQPHKRKTG